MQSGETAGEGKLIAEMLNWGAKNKIFFLGSSVRKERTQGSDGYTLLEERRKKSERCPLEKSGKTKRGRREE